MNLLEPRSDHRKRAAGAIEAGLPAASFHGRLPIGNVAGRAGELGSFAL
jgi:hypothetical protein